MLEKIKIKMDDDDDKNFGLGEKIDEYDSDDEFRQHGVTYFNDDIKF
jgi:hypothetical protein